ncbi:MAG: hypothetical protein WEC59_11930 [Salibacteraceae bacterium]
MLLAIVVQCQPVTNFYSISDATFENNGTWSSNNHNGNSSNTNPGCVINGRVNIYIEDSLSSNCQPLKINGNVNFIIRNGGHLNLTGAVEILGNANFSIDENSSLIINGDLEVAGNGDMELDGSLVVNGDVSVSGNAEVCGSGDAQVSGTISGTGWCMNIGLLPIDLISFKAVAKNDEHIVISWLTAVEINNDKFVLERSINGLTFDPIIEIAGAGNSNTENKYSYTDTDVTEGTYYYRLTQIDFNGDSETFDIASATIENASGEECEMEVNPNPCVPSCKAVLDCPGGVFKTYVMDGYGRMISELIPISNYNGRSTYHINRGNFLMPGVYIINARSAEKNISKKVMIK